MMGTIPAYTITTSRTLCWRMPRSEVEMLSMGKGDGGGVGERDHQNFPFGGFGEFVSHAKAELSLAKLGSAMLV